MDNASRAILFAGAILITTGLIGLGIYLFRAGGMAAQETASSITSNEIMAINSQFTRFRGECMGIEVKQLLRLMYTHNQNYDADVTLNGNTFTTTTHLNEALRRVTESKTYEVSISNADYDAVGLIRNINIPLD